MRIAVLMLASCPWARTVATQFSLQGHDVHVVDFLRTPKAGNYVSGDFQNEAVARLSSTVSGLHYLPTPFSSSLRYLAAARPLGVLCRRLDVDFLISLYGGGFGMTAWLSRFRPYAIYAVGSDILFANGLIRPVVQRSLKAAAVVFANGEHLAEQTRLLAPTAHVMPLLIGVDTDFLAPKPSPRGPTKLLCSRGFLPVYNNEAIIRAIAELPDDTPPFHLTFTSAGSLLPHAKDLATSLLPRERRQQISFLGGVSDEEMHQQLAQSEIFLSMSRSDGTATSLLEAMSSGLFPILSDIPQNREWITPSADNGLLVDPDDTAGLAVAISSALTDGGRRQQATTHNRGLVTARADCRRNMKTLTAELEKHL
jgi:glycosyltransferase involved in cell wall biosynthesis